MSMICYVGQIADLNIEKIKGYPKLVEQLIDGDEEIEKPKRSFFQKLFSKKEVEPVSVNSNLIEPVEAICDLDKAWHGVHYTLTGSDWQGAFPLNFLASGGEEVGEDMGYGPIRFLTSAQTKTLKNELDKITLTDFENRFNAAALTKFEIYPCASGWTDEDKPWLADEYASIKKFIDDAVANEKGIFINIA